MIKKSFYIVFTVFFLSGCVQPIELETIDYQDILVVEALLTNESKHHTVKLSRTFKLDSVGPKIETGALVLIKDNNQNTYSFTENSNGEYVSDRVFSAEFGKSYTLEITTKNGTVYSSSAEQIQKIDDIKNIEVIKETDNFNKDGISFYITPNSTNNNENYFRYEFEETYKIIAPEWNDRIINIISDVFPWEVELVYDSKNVHKKICYKTQSSNSLILAEEGSNNQENFKSKIRFIDEKNYLISSRYTILVKQFSISLDVFNYYKTLKKISSSESIFTQTQPGQIASNISSLNKNKSVLGVFEVASVSEKRIFINREDYFPNSKADYITECDDLVADELFFRDSEIYSPLIATLQHNFRTFHSLNLSPTKAYPGDYWLVRKACGDCSVVGNSTKPNFWID